MQLLLWRHAHALPGSDDSARPLSAYGEAQAACAAEWLNKHLADDCRILVSPARRAQQTAAALQRDFTTVEALHPESSVDDVLAAIPPYDGMTLLVGHQPFLGELVIALLEDDFDAFKWHPTTASVCWLEWVNDESGKPRAKLKQVYVPE